MADRCWPIKVAVLTILSILPVIGADFSVQPASQLSTCADSDLLLDWTIHDESDISSVVWSFNGVWFAVKVGSSVSASYSGSTGITAAKVEHTTSGKIVIKNPVVADSGEYSCRVVYTAASGLAAASSTATVIVVTAPSDPTLTTTGDTYTCSSYSTSVTVSIKVDNVGKGTTIYTGSVDSSVECCLSGYAVQCRSDTSGTEYCKQLIAFRHHQPSITSLYVEGNNNIVSENDTVKIVCETDSIPASTFTWTRQSDLASLPETGSMLTLSSVQCSDTTFFTCTASNNIGSAATKTIQLFVQCQPRIDSKSPQGTAYGAVGESINITVQHIIAFPPPMFLWGKANGDTLPPSTQTDTNTSSTLTVRQLDVDDFGNYSVTIDNNIGQPFVFYIEVGSESHPLKPTNVIVISSTTNSVILSWTPGFDGGAAQNFSIQYRRDGGSDFSNYRKSFLDENIQPMTAAVDGLEEGTVYYFRLIAINRFGESPVTEERRVVTTANVAKPESNVGPVIGGAIACVVVGALGMMAVIYLWRRYQKRRKSQATTNRIEERANDSTYQDLTQNRSVPTLEYQTLNLSEQATFTPVYSNLELNVTSTNRNDPHHQNLTHN